MAQRTTPEIGEPIDVEVRCAGESTDRRHRTATLAVLTSGGWWWTVSTEARAFDGPIMRTHDGARIAVLWPEIPETLSCPEHGAVAVDENVIRSERNEARRLGRTRSVRLPPRW